jgi:hypothetical protein
VFTKDGICTLTDIIIINSMQANLFLRSCAIQRFVTSNVAQAKEKNYHNQHPIDQFFPLTIEVFGSLHKHVDVFLHNYANVIWSLKGIEGPYLSTLVDFFC